MDSQPGRIHRLGFRSLGFTVNGFRSLGCTVGIQSWIHRLGFRSLGSTVDGFRVLDSQSMDSQAWIQSLGFTVHGFTGWIYRLDSQAWIQKSWMQSKWIQSSWHSQSMQAALCSSSLGIMAPKAKAVPNGAFMVLSSGPRGGQELKHTMTCDMTLVWEFTLVSSEPTKERVVLPGTEEWTLHTAASGWAFIQSGADKKWCKEFIKGIVYEAEAGKTFIKEGSLTTWLRDYEEKCEKLTWISSNYRVRIVRFKVDIEGENTFFELRGLQDARRSMDSEPSDSESMDSETWIHSLGIHCLGIQRSMDSESMDSETWIQKSRGSETWIQKPRDSESMDSEPWIHNL
eukprot:11201462-Lingulodinium_polyedra.AAC.1